MYCPRCGSSQSDELKFCKACGANLAAVRRAVDVKETDGKIDWSRSWVAEMFLSSQEAERRQAELDRARGITPEVKRYNEIKAGVITASIGLAFMIFLHVFMEGIILGAGVPSEAAEILARVWIAGVIPLFVGLALIINGTFISKKQVDATRRALEMAELGIKPAGLRPAATNELAGLRSADTNEFVPTNFSVTEETTRHLQNSDPESKRNQLT